MGEYTESYVTPRRGAFGTFGREESAILRRSCVVACGTGREVTQRHRSGEKRVYCAGDDRIKGILTPLFTRADRLHGKFLDAIYG